MRFIYYNAISNVEPGSREAVGGIALFKSLCKYYQHDAKFQRQPKVMTLFNWDAFNPSLESSVTKGKHMVPAINNIETSVAYLGNHELDFSVEQFEYLASQCTFPWLCVNVLDPALGPKTPLGNCNRTVILTAFNGIKYLSAFATTAELVPNLREEGAEMVLVLSHQREPNDNKLAAKLKPGTVDLILGGHDHFYSHWVMRVDC